MDTKYIKQQHELLMEKRAKLIKLTQTKEHADAIITITNYICRLGQVWNPKISAKAEQWLEEYQGYKL